MVKKSGIERRLPKHPDLEAGGGKKSGGGGWVVGARWGVRRGVREGDEIKNGGKLGQEIM